MIKNKHDALDKKILAAIKKGKNDFASIWKQCFYQGEYPDERNVDARLQALKRKGQIAYSGRATGWQLVPQETAQP